MPARFELMHDSGSFAAMALCAFSDSAGCSRGRLPIFHTRAIAVDDKSRNNQAGCDDDRNEYASKSQDVTPDVIVPICEAELRLAILVSSGKYRSVKNASRGSGVIANMFTD
jgi:hypothetical protein